MSTETAVEITVLTCPTDGKILGEYCKTDSDSYECPQCRQKFSESEVMV